MFEIVFETQNDTFLLANVFCEFKTRGIRLISYVTLKHALFI